MDGSDNVRKKGYLRKTSMKNSKIIFNKIKSLLNLDHAYQEYCDLRKKDDLWSPKR